MVAPKGPGHTVEANMKLERVFRLWSLYIRMQPEKALDKALAYSLGIGGQEPVFWRQHSELRQRQTCSASRQCCAEVSVH